MSGDRDREDAGRRPTWRNPTESRLFPISYGRYKRAARRILTPRYRYARGHLGPLPDFMIIGAGRSGSSSLYQAITSHPAISPAVQKEINFFNDGFDLGERWYRAFFDPALTERGGITGEASIRYFWHPLAPARVRSLTPDIRLIVILREPVSRAISNYYQSVRSGWRLPPVEQALRREMTLVTPLLDASWPEIIAHRGKNLDRPTPLITTLYDFQLRNWFDYFDRAQFLILRSDDFFRDQATVLRRVFEFVGAAPGQAIPEVHLGAAEYEPISPEFRAEFIEFFRQPNRRLKDLTGIDFNPA